MTRSDEGAAARVPINIEIPAEMKDRLITATRREGLSQASILRIALNEWLAAHGYPRSDA
jgi:hypothetical protein